MEKTYENEFDRAMARYQSGEEAIELIKDFEAITTSAPNNASGWTCLSWLQLLCDKPDAALHSAQIAVKLNNQEPQARINLSLALLETKSKGVRNHIELVKKVIAISPEYKKELQSSILDGLERKPHWEALQKVKNWLDL